MKAFRITKQLRQLCLPISLLHANLTLLDSVFMSLVLPEAVGIKTSWS